MHCCSLRTNWLVRLIAKSSLSILFYCKRIIFISVFLESRIFIHVILTLLLSPLSTKFFQAIAGKFHLIHNNYTSNNIKRSGHCHLQYYFSWMRIHFNWKYFHHLRFLDSSKTPEANIISSYKLSCRGSPRWINWTNCNRDNDNSTALWRGRIHDIDPGQYFKHASNNVFVLVIIFPCPYLRGTCLCRDFAASPSGHR